MADRLDLQTLRRYAGKWIAWDRNQTNIVATGETFEAVKAAAAQKGEQSVLVAEVPAERNWLQRSCRFLHVFAVFIALSQPLAAVSPMSPNLAQNPEETEWLDELSEDEN